MGHGILVPQPRIEPTFPIFEDAALITGLPGKVPILYTFAFPACWQFVIGQCNNMWLLTLLRL